MAEVEEILKQLESDNPDPGIEQAREKLDEDDLSEEDVSRLNYGIAAGLFKLANYRGALDWLEKSQDPRRHIFRGFCHLELEEPEQAVSAFEEAAQSEPDRQNEALLMKAQSLMILDRVEEAQDLYEELIERTSATNVSIESRMGLAVSCIETDDYSRARDLLESILDQYEETEYRPEVLFYLVEVLESQGQVEQAVERAEELKEIGEDTMWEGMAGELLQRLHNQSKDRRSKLRDYEY